MATAKEQLKDLFPFLQRATEMEKVDKKVAYYCELPCPTAGGIPLPPALGSRAKGSSNISLLARSFRPCMRYQRTGGLSARSPARL